MQSITPERLKQRIDGGDNLELIDVRDPWEFEICRIQGSRNIPMTEIESQLAAIDSSMETVLICHHGVRSLQIAAFLESLGYQHLYNLDGGINRWSGTVDPDMPQY